MMIRSSLSPKHPVRSGAKSKQDKHVVHFGSVRKEKMLSCSLLDHNQSQKVYSTALNFEETLSLRYHAQVASAENPSALFCRLRNFSFLVCALRRDAESPNCKKACAIPQQLLHDIDENYQLVDEVNRHSKNNGSCEWLGRRRNGMRATTTRRRNIIAFPSDVLKRSSCGLLLLTEILSLSV